MNEHDLIARGFVKESDGSWHKPKHKAGGVASSPVVESDTNVQPVAKDEGEASDAVRCLVRYTLFRVRTVDQENWCTKHFTDALVLSRLLFDDTPKWCQIEVEQVKVRFPSEERTEIEIIPMTAATSGTRQTPRRIPLQ